MISHNNSDRDDSGIFSVERSRPIKPTLICLKPRKFPSKIAHNYAIDILNEDQTARMSEYSDVIAYKLRLKGKTPLCVKSDGIAKKKKHNKQFYKLFAGDNMTTDSANNEDERLTPAEKRYLERWQQIELQRLVKIAKKSHRDRIQEFNHYLANLTEHYDIPKVGPG